MRLMEAVRSLADELAKEQHTARIKALKGYITWPDDGYDVSTQTSDVRACVA